MNSVFKAVAIGLSLLFATTVFAHLPIKTHFQPSFGIDVAMSQQHFETSFGDEHFREDYPDANFYINAKLFEYLNFGLGIEGGYEHRFRQQEQAFYPAEGITVPVLGFSSPLNTDPVLYLSHVSAQAWHLNLEGFWAICPQTEITALIGIAWMEMFFDTVAVSDPTVATPIARWNSGNHALLRMGVGLRQMITQHFGARIQAIWENTSKLEATTAVPLPLGVEIPLSQADNYTAKPKNSYSVGVGFFFEFPRFY